MPAGNFPLFAPPESRRLASRLAREAPRARCDTGHGRKAQPDRALCRAEVGGINYLVKIVTNGIFSSVGVKSNKKKIKRYKKESESRKLPVPDIE
jgi:hypothetical protein